MFQIGFVLVLLLHFCHSTWLDIFYYMSSAHYMFVAVIESFLLVPLYPFIDVNAFWRC
jgi:hypothetical protein